MDHCKVCGKPSMVMAADYSKKVAFRKGRDARSFICGLCVAHGALRRRVEQPDEEHFNLRLWRKSQGLTQTDLAERLFVSRVQVSKVESGERIMPDRWASILEKMYPNHV